VSRPWLRCGDIDPPSATASPTALVNQSAARRSSSRLSGTPTRTAATSLTAVSVPSSYTALMRYVPGRSNTKPAEPNVSGTCSEYRSGPSAALSVAAGASVSGAGSSSRHITDV
jgi:hypothetical protein